ncbi:MAG: ABC transporter substrate-binding protein [Lachnospiraceae bacterium]|nr:ABC transporter substrate-binding protein [Lachnospiraceae bacterium]
MRQLSKRLMRLAALGVAVMLTGCGAGQPMGAGGAGDTGAAGAEAGEIGSQTEVPAEKQDTSAPAEGLLRIAVDEEQETMDIDRTSGDYAVPLNVYDRLFEVQQNLDGSTELIPSLVKEYSLSEDGRTYHFTLRDDVLFSDGSKLTARDVAFSFSRMLQPESSQTDFADAILGAEAVMSGEVETPEGIRVINDTQIEITLKAPFAGYLPQLATPSCSILCEKSVREGGDAFGTDPAYSIGSGPYIVTEWRPDFMRFVANPYYWGEAPSAKEVEARVIPPVMMHRAFQNRELDILDGQLINRKLLEKDYARGRYRNRIVRKSNVELRCLILNNEFEPLDNVKVRKAIQMAIDREKILKTVYGGGGTIMDGIFPKGLIGYTKDNQGWLQYDPEQAKKLLADAGYADGFSLEVAANVEESVADKTVLHMISQDLEEIGIRVSIVNYDESPRNYLRKRGLIMCYLARWVADDNDPDNFLYTFFGSRENSVYRSVNYGDESLFQRVVDARSIVQEEKRLAEYAAIEKKLFQDEAVWVPLYSCYHDYVIGERVSSFTPYWAGWHSIIYKDVVLK